MATEAAPEVEELTIYEDKPEEELPMYEDPQEDISPDAEMEMIEKVSEKIMASAMEDPNRLQDEFATIFQYFEQMEKVVGSSTKFDFTNFVHKKITLKKVIKLTQRLISERDTTFVQARLKKLTQDLAVNASRILHMIPGFKFDFLPHKDPEPAKPQLKEMQPPSEDEDEYEVRVRREPKVSSYVRRKIREAALGVSDTPPRTRPKKKVTEEGPRGYGKPTKGDKLLKLLQTAVNDGDIEDRFTARDLINANFAEDMDFTKNYSAAFGNTLKGLYKKGILEKGKNDKGKKVYWFASGGGETPRYGGVTPMYGGTSVAGTAGTVSSEESVGRIAPSDTPFLNPDAPSGREYTMFKLQLLQLARILPYQSRDEIISKSLYETAFSGNNEQYFRVRTGRTRTVLHYSLKPEYFRKRPNRADSKGGFSYLKDWFYELPTEKEKLDELIGRYVQEDTSGTLDSVRLMLDSNNPTFKDFLASGKMMPIARKRFIETVIPQDTDEDKYIYRLSKYRLDYPFPDKWKFLRNRNIATSDKNPSNTSTTRNFKAMFFGYSREQGYWDKIKKNGSDYETITCTRKTKITSRVTRVRSSSIT